MSEYGQPLTVTYGWNCPYHSVHLEKVVLYSKPHGNKIISRGSCASPYPNEPTYHIKLYGNLRLVNSVKGSGEVL